MTDSALLAALPLCLAGVLGTWVPAARGTAIPYLPGGKWRGERG